MRVLSGLFFMLFLGVSFAQQDAQYTQYMYGTTTINPAYVGSRNTLNILLSHRSQWIGLEGAPVSQLVSINSALGEKQGIGASLFRDEIGPARTTSFATDYSYSLQLNREDLKLAFGIKAGIHALSVNFNKLNIYNPTDPVFEENIRNRISPIIGAGAYLYTDKWYVGLSIPNFLQTRHFSNTTISRTTKQSMHCYAIAGYVLELNEDIQMKPTTLLKATGGAPLSIDISTNFIFYSKFSLGFSMRINGEISSIGSFQISEQFMLGYSYDYSFNDFGKFNNGSHELILKYELPIRKRRPKYLRCF